MKQFLLPFKAGVFEIHKLLFTIADSRFDNIRYNNRKTIKFDRNILDNSCVKNWVETIFIGFDLARKNLYLHNIWFVFKVTYNWLLSLIHINSIRLVVKLKYCLIILYLTHNYNNIFTFKIIVSLYILKYILFICITCFFNSSNDSV